MRSPDDQAVRDRALAADTSFIIQAPAGSGKTELLIQRYLKLLGYVKEPEEIVAITFTLKAAGEMRERIIEALRGAATDHRGTANDNECDGPDIETRRLELAHLAMDNDRQQGWEIINHPSRLQIQTIDALCLGLTRQLPFLSGFAAPSGIVEDADFAYRRAALEAIKLLGGPNEDWRQALERFLFHVDNDLSRAVELVAAMLASRDQWLRHIGDESVASGNLRLAWSGLVETYLRRTDELLPASLKPVLVQCAGSAAACLATEPLPDTSVWLDRKGFPGTSESDLPSWRFIAFLLLKKGAPLFRRSVTKKEGFPPGSSEKKSMQDLLGTLADDDALAEALHTVRLLPDPSFDAEQAVILDAMITTLKLAVAQLELIFEETVQVDFIEVTQRAIAALGALEDPSDLALKLDYQIQHLLVDEFQDTSIAQYNLLTLLTQGWSPGDGRTLFLVGDPMQSIYRFREAEVGVYLKVWREGLGGVPVEPLTLSSNFRSSPRIVEWVNGVFGERFPRLSDPSSGAVAYAETVPRVAETDKDARVYMHPFIDSGEAEQADWLARLVAQALDRSNQVAILIRARSHLGAILPALKTRNVPYTGMDVTALVDEPVVRDLYSLTRALLHPGDRMAWLSLLRAPWCGLKLKDLLIAAGPRRSLVWNSLHDPDIRANLSPDGLVRIERFISALQDAMVQRGRLSLHRWVRRAWVSLDGPALLDEAGLLHAQSYFDLLHRYHSGMNLVDDRAFREALEKQWAHAEARTHSVQLMTIHKAKGLEFDEVFLPALDRPPRPNPERLLLWEEPADGEGLLLASMPAWGGPDDKHYRFVRRLQSEKSVNETDRLFYVACTRARKRLHLLANLRTRDGVPTPPKKDSLLQRIWPSVETYFPNIGTTVPGYPAQKEIPDMDTRHGLKRLPAVWSAPAFPAAVPTAPPATMGEHRVEFSWAGETARQVGILVHKVIQRIAGEGIEQWNDERVKAMLPVWRERLSHLGVAPGDLDEAVHRSADSIRNLLEDERAAWLLDAHHTQVENEVEVSVLESQRVKRLRIDRTFVDNQGVRWIVDYKTSAHEGSAPEVFLDEELRRYKQQMDTYASAFRKMESNEIRLGLYFPLLKGWREWRYSE